MWSSGGRDRLRGVGSIATIVARFLLFAAKTKKTKFTRWQRVNMVRRLAILHLLFKRRRLRLFFLGGSQRLGDFMSIRIVEVQANEDMLGLAMESRRKTWVVGLFLGGVVVFCRAVAPGVRALSGHANFRFVSGVRRKLLSLFEQALLFDRISSFRSVGCLIVRGNRLRLRRAIAVPRKRLAGKQSAAVPLDRLLDQRGRLEGALRT